MSPLPTAIVDEVWRRAKNCCEYCRMPHALDPLPFQIDHIISQQHDGSSDLSNLALACMACNNHKGPNLSGYDAERHRIVRLFHPRRDRWRVHFEWHGPELRGRTAVGRVTIHVLAANLPYRIALRQSLIVEGVFSSARKR